MDNVASNTPIKANKQTKPPAGFRMVQSDEFRGLIIAIYIFFNLKGTVQRFANMAIVNNNPQNGLYCSHTFIQYMMLTWDVREAK